MTGAGGQGSPDITHRYGHSLGIGLTIARRSGNILIPVWKTADAGLKLEVVREGRESEEGAGENIRKTSAI